MSPPRSTPPTSTKRPDPREAPRAYALRMARAKLAAVACAIPARSCWRPTASWLCGRRILPKAETEAEARACLALLSGRRHRVLGGVAVGAPTARCARGWSRPWCASSGSSRPSSTTISASGEWRGKAGGYAIQGRAARFIAFVSGSYSNVVGSAAVRDGGSAEGRSAVSKRRPVDLSRAAQGVPDGAGRRRPPGRAADRAPRHALAGRERVPRPARTGDARSRCRVRRYRHRPLGLPARRGSRRQRRLAAGRARRCWSRCATTARARRGRACR